MSNALKEGLVAYYPLQSNAVNMVDGVAGTINGTASWVKNHAGKVVLDDTTASVTHASHDIDTVTYWKDGRFYAVLNGVPYMIDEELSSSFISCANATTIGCNILPFHAWIPSAENLYDDGSGYILLDSGTAATKYNLVGYNGAGAVASRTNLTIGSTNRSAILYDGSMFFRGTSNYPDFAEYDYIECLHETGYTTTVETVPLSTRPSGSVGFTLLQAYTSAKTQGLYWNGTFAFTGSAITTPVYFGIFVQSSSVRIKDHANPLVTISQSGKTNVYPLSIGCQSGASGGGGTLFHNRRIADVLHFRGITPASVDTFLAKRYARVIAGTWQPYIPLEDLV